MGSMSLAKFLSLGLLLFQARVATVRGFEHQQGEDSVDEEPGWSNMNDVSETSEVKTRDLYHALHPPPPSERLGPYFDPANPVNVLSPPQGTVTLHCKVNQRGNKTVSWVRHKDLSLLTVGRYTYISDLRFSVLHDAIQEDWKLQIERPAVNDSGIYECQISTTPPMSLQVNLTVLQAETELVGGPDIYVARGSTINLTCLIKNSVLPPETVTWYHNNKVIDYKSPRGGVSVATEKGQTSSSTLVLLFARASDSGEYRCEPSNGSAAIGKIHVLNGEYQAPMQSGIGIRGRVDLQVLFALGAILQKFAT